MKYIALFILVFVFTISLLGTGVYQRKKGYTSGIEMGKLEAKSQYLTEKRAFVDSFYKAHQPEHDLVDSLTMEILKQGKEARIINKKLVKKFKL